MYVIYRERVYVLDSEGDLIRFWMLLRRQGQRDDLRTV